jgi:hypothetical protein
MLCSALALSAQAYVTVIHLTVYRVVLLSVIFFPSQRQDTLPWKEHILELVLQLKLHFSFRHLFYILSSKNMGKS